MAKGGGDQTVKSEPWAGQKDYLTDIFRQAQGAYDATPKDAFAGDLYAPLNAQQTAAQDYGLQLAQAFGGLGDSLINLGTATARGDFLGPNQYLQDYAGVVSDQAGRQFTQQISPAITSQAIAQGAYGGSREGVSQGLAAGEVSRATSDALTQMMANAYAQERQLQQGAGNLIQQGMSVAGAPAQILAGIGRENQQNTQAQLDEALRLWQMNQDVPWIGLDKYANLVQGAPAFSTQTQSGGAPGWATGLMGGGVLGGLAGNVLGGATGWDLAPWALGGAGLGGIFGSF